MSKNIYENVNRLNDRQLRYLIQSMYRSGAINDDILNNLDGKKYCKKQKDKVIKSLQYGKKVLDSEELSELLNIRVPDVEKIFQLENNKMFPIENDTLLFGNLKYYNCDNLFSNKRYLVELLNGLVILNNYLKYHDIGIKKKDVYLCKNYIILKLVKCGFVESWHLEEKDGGQFYGITFNVFGNTYKFHQPTMAIFKTCMDATLEEEKIPFYKENVDRYKDVPKETILNYYRYVMFTYVRYCKFFE